jgi:hypothetical protein
MSTVRPSNNHSGPQDHFIWVTCKIPKLGNARIPEYRNADDAGQQLTTGQNTNAKLTFSLHSGIYL